MPDTTAENRTLPQLLADLTTDLATLVRTEVQLARAELGEKAGQLAKAAAAGGVGAVLLLAALLFVLHAIALGLSEFMAPVWAYLLVGVVTGIAGAVAIRGAISAAKPENLSLDKTQRQLRDTVRVAREQVAGEPK